MNVVADKFVEYNSVDAEGNVVSPASNVVTFTKDANKKEMETIINAEQAAEYSLDKVFPNWAPADIAQQTTVGIVSLTDNTLTWEAAKGATAYAIVCNNEIVDIVDANTLSYAVSNADATYAVRAANGMGGFSEAIKVGEAGTNIKNAVSDNEKETIIHTLGGVRINKVGGKGIYIVNGTKKTN